MFYSLPCLYGFLPRIFHAHLAQLSFSVFLLLKEVVLEQDTQEAEERLRIFVMQMENLYGHSSVTFNVHQLLHLSKSVRMFGPLRATSTFSFEDGNGRILRLVSAAKGVPMQIAERLVMRETLKAAKLLVPLNSSFEHSTSLLERKRGRLFNVSVLGSPQPGGPLSQDLQTHFMNSLGFVPSMQRCLRAQIGQMIVHSVKYTCAEKTCSSYVQMRDRRYCNVVDIFSYTANSTEKIALYV